MDKNGYEQIEFLEAADEVFVEEQLEMNEVAASLGTLSSTSSGSCPGSSVGTLTTASSFG
ncbi:thiocillin family RiPP [Saccharibacillus qingshengii]|uniref:thiocillin family RiPP n=1 Tax=Saccharibacillus qingshengii TaxID=1763540 RepID=UPI00155354AB|nr:thiocillin family RiPP [Saccharibacillus qingshengii]